MLNDTAAAGCDGLLASKTASGDQHPPITQKMTKKKRYVVEFESFSVMFFSALVKLR